MYDSLTITDLKIYTQKHCIDNIYMNKRVAKMELTRKKLVFGEFKVEAGARVVNVFVTFTNLIG